MSQELTLHQVPFNHLYRDLSFEDFFNRYDPWRDGKVKILTYTFSDKNFDFWAKLKPESTLYVDKKYEHIAQRFVKRYPWFEIYSVSQLHSKVVFFENSGLLLIGSENLFSPSSKFSEIMIETVVYKKDYKEVLDLLFGGLDQTPLYCKYTLKDIHIYRQGLYQEGTLCLPSNFEVRHLDIISNRIKFDESGEKYPKSELSNPGQLYTIFEYTVDDQKYYLGTDRGYHYCGDLDENLFKWIIENCQIVQVEDNYTGGHFPSYHTISKDRIPDRVFWLGLINNHEQYESKKIEPSQIDITNRKFRRGDSLTSYI